MSKRVAEIVVDTLQAAGVRHCYGIVGDTLNHVTDALHRSEIEWVHVRHEEVAAFAAGAESLISGRLTVCDGSCGPGSLHFINGIFESNRNRAPMVLIASQIVTVELGMEFPQEVEFKAVYSSCSVFCEQVHSPEQVRRVVTLACQAAISRRGVAVVILPADISEAEVKHDRALSLHYTQPVLRPSDAELKRISRADRRWQAHRYLLRCRLRACTRRIGRAGTAAADADGVYLECQGFRLKGGGVQQQLAELRRAGAEGRRPARQLHRSEESGFRTLGRAHRFYGRTVTRSEELEQAVCDFLAQPGPALLDVHTSPTELVVPPQVEAQQVAGTALYAAKALLNGRVDDVRALLANNFLNRK